MSSATSTLSISGLGSGYDWEGVISKLQAVEENRLVPYTTQLTTLESEQTAWTTLGTYLSTLQTALEALTDEDDYATYTATLTSSSSSVSASSLLSVTADSDADASSYSIVVKQLAQAEKLQSATDANYTSTTDALGKTGTLTINGEELTLDGSESLSDLKDAINDLDAGVTASILQDSDGYYHLTLTSDTTGADGISLTDLSGSDAIFSTTALQEGLDAEFSVDGINMTSSTNTTDTAIEGLTLNFLGADSSVTINTAIEQNTEDIASKVQDFVDAYNTVLAFYSNQMTYDSDSDETGGALFGDTTLKSLKNSMQTLVLNSGLSDLGITFNDDNELELDTDVLEEALSSDSSGTISTLSTLANSLNTTLTGYTDEYDGTITLLQDSLDDNIDRVEDKISTMSDLIEKKMDMLRTKFINMDTALAEYESLSEYLTGQIESLSSSSSD